MIFWWFTIKIKLLLTNKHKFNKKSKHLTA